MIEKYFLKKPNVDCLSCLKSWHWLLPNEFTVLFINLFGELFITLNNECVYRLRMDTGELENLANTKTEFYKKMNKGTYASEWLLIQVADKLIDNGIKLKDGECYGFIKYPIIGGGYMSENFKPISAFEYITFMGKLYENLQKLPDDEKIELNLTAKNIHSLSSN